MGTLSHRAADAASVLRNVRDACHAVGTLRDARRIALRDAAAAQAPRLGVPPHALYSALVGPRFEDSVFAIGLERNG